MNVITVSKKDPNLYGTVTLPASKSISNRMLIIRELSGKEFPVSNLSPAEDTLLLQQLLARIGKHGDHETTGELNAQNAGTVLRFLAAYLALRPGRWILTGNQRMQQRPVGILVESLQKLGAVIRYLSLPGYPPLEITGRLLKGGGITVDATVSSQFVSALLMIAPCLSGGLTLTLRGLPVSAPYVELTIGLMQEQGITVIREKNRIRVEPGAYSGKEIRVEADWSSAAFWYEAAALSENACLEIPGLNEKSLQGDRAVADIYRRFGVETVFGKEGVVLSRQERRKEGGQGGRRSGGKGGGIPSVELSRFPDLAPALIVTSSVLGVPVWFTGLGHLRIKESDRLKALETELKRLGRTILHPRLSGGRTASGVIGKGSGAPISPQDLADNPGPVDTYGDHRIAMAFAPLPLRTGKIRISDPEVVGKSYPGFWEEMKRVGFRIS